MRKQTCKILTVESMWWAYDCLQVSQHSCMFQIFHWKNAGENGCLVLLRCRVNSGSWWWTERPGMLQFMGLQRVGHNWVTELNWSKTVPRGSATDISSSWGFLGSPDGPWNINMRTVSPLIKFLMNTLWCYSHFFFHLAKFAASETSQCFNKLTP